MRFFLRREGYCNRNHSTANGVLDTLAWEGYREAIDDVRYLKTLEQTIAQAPTATSPAVRQAVTEAQAYLNELRSTVLQLAGTGATVAGFQMDLNQKREEIIRHIETLKAETQAEAQRQAYWEQITNREMVAFPNPAQKQVTFRWREAVNQSAEIFIYDVSGRLVTKLKTAQPHLTEISWNVQNIASGVYLYHTVLTGDSGAVKKIPTQKLGIVH